VTALAFFLSGLAALVYQVTWQRILALHSGVGIYSIAVIVAAFMLGLGAGSHAGGVVSARLTPPSALRAFALIELGIAAFGALSVTLYYDLLYVHAAWLYAPLWRAAILHVLALAAPTFLMGMSLPFLVRAMVRSAPTAGATIGRLYAVNLIGAATGAALTPWVLIRLSGMRGAVLCAAAANVGAAVLVFLSRPQPAEDELPAAEEPSAAVRVAPLSLPAWGLLYALGGFCALSLEMLWFRIADVALKATSFTFGTVLAVYLLGMAAGTFAGVGIARRARDPLRGFLRCQAGILVWAGAAVLALAFAPPRVPPLPALLEYWSAPRPFNLGADWNAGTLLLLYVAVPAFLYGIPTVLMGLSFALLQRAVHDDPRTSGRKVGVLQAANIAGCVLGTLVVGLGALGWWGTTGTLRALMVAGLVFVAVMARRRPLAWDTVAFGAALVTLAVALPGQTGLWLRLHGDVSGDAMVEEDATGMAAMIPGGGRYSLWVNGRTNSSLPFGGFHTLLGATPAVMHAQPREVAIVGLGSGDTAWASGCRRETSRVTVYEICAPQIALLQRLARAPQPPGRLMPFLQDPRIRTVVEDGRNALARSDPRFDVIEMDALFPSSPFSGNLYSLEFFRLCARRLRPGGLMSAWSPKPRVTATFMAAFPYVIEMRQGQLLVGSNQPIEIRAEEWRARAASPEVVSYLGANNARKLAEALATARVAEPVAVAADDLNRDLFPRDEFKVGSDDP
jgi:predicted membrane-bound spermidine synthase